MASSLPRRIQVRRSGVHGRGVYAVGPIAAGERIVEYKGERISDEEADRRHPADPKEPHHTFYFSLEGGGVIDARFGGNSARWINHSCAPNCRAVLEEDPRDRRRDRVLIETLRPIRAGEELTYDYGISLEERHTPRLKRIWACRCGAPACTGTMLKPKRARAA